MKPSQFYTAVALALLGLILSVAVILQGETSISAQKAFQQRQLEIQTEFQQKQNEVNEGNLSNQIATNMVKDIASTAYDAATGDVKNQKLKDLLTRYGINVTVNPKNSPAK